MGTDDTPPERAGSDDDAPRERVSSNDAVPPERIDSDGDSLADKAQRPVVTDCVKYLALLFAIAAVALAAFVLLLDVVDQDTLGVSAEGMGEELTDANTTIADGVAFYLLVVIGVVGIVGSAFVGAFFGWLLREDDDTAMLAAAASAFVGVLVLWVLGGLLGAIFTELSEEMGDLIVNGVLAGLGGAIAAGGGAWATRNRLPPALDPRPSRDEPDPARRER